MKTWCKGPVHRALAASVAALLLVSCADTSDSPVSNETLNKPAHAAYEAGHQLLFNAKTRFEYPKAIEALAAAVAEDAEHAPTRVALSYAHTKQGQHDQAKPHLEVAHALSETLSESDALWLAAIDARAADEIEREVSAWESIVERFPDDRWAWYELASANTVRHDHEAAAAAAERALALEPDPARWEASWIYYLHSKALYRSGRPEEAIAAADAGRNNETTWRSTYYRRELAAIAAGKQDPQVSVEGYKELSATEGRNSEPYTEANIALFYFELGDYEKAVAHARTSLALAQSAYQYWTLGYSLTENGEAAEALRLTEEALKTYPEDSYVLSTHGWALYRLGRNREAREFMVAAQAASARKQYQIEWSLDVIDKALENPDASPAPPIPWLG